MPSPSILLVNRDSIGVCVRAAQKLLLVSARDRYVATDLNEKEE